MESAERLSYNKMFVAYLRTFARIGFEGSSDPRAEPGPIGGDLSQSWFVSRGDGGSGVYCNRDVLDLPVPGDESVDYESDLTPIIKQSTQLYAATEDVHDAARFEREVPGRASASIHAALK